MISGIGTDIVETGRIKKMLKEHEESFIERVFTPREISEASKRKDPAEYYAGRWAVKEAAAKALGCGIGASCSWKDIETLNEIEGKPVSSFSGDASATAGKEGIKSIHVSISHEKDYACAFVVLEK